MDDNLIGQQWGNYRLKQLLGRGGFAEVYLGEHVRLHITAAVKLLHTHLSDEGAAAFQHEAQVIADLAHPHIVRVLDFDVQKGRPFLVLDYAPGGSLKRLHPRGSRVPSVQIVEYVRQLADALSYAHEQKLIHRDIKPENMLVGRLKEVLLTDFGIVAIAHSTSSMSTQASMGTLPYMAPEQIQGKPRPQSDQYALAVTVYQWLSGTQPFQGSSVEIIAQHLGVPAPSLHIKVPEISQEVDQVVLKALAKAPQERFATVQDFAVALEQAVMASLRHPTISPVPQYASASQHPSPTDTTIVAPPTNQKKPAPDDTTVRDSSSSPHPPASPAAFQKSTTTPTSAPLQVQPRLQAAPIVSRREVVTGLVIGGVSLGSAALLGYLSGSNPPNTTSTQNDVKYSYTLNTGDTFREAAYWLAWSPNGKYLAAMDSLKVRVWTPLDGKIVTTYTVQADGILDMAWSPDSQRIAVAGGRMGVGGQKVFVWNATSGKNILTYQGRTDFGTLSWSADGQYIATGEADGQVHIWNATDGKISHSFSWSDLKPDPKLPVAPSSMRWSPNGKYIAVSGGANLHSVEIFQATNGKKVAEADLAGAAGWRAALAWSSDSAYIAAIDGTHPLVQIWQANTGNSVMIYRGHTGSIINLAWSPDGAYVASVSDGTVNPGVHVWSTKTGERVKIHRLSDATGLDWSPDGRYIAASNPDRIILWQAP